MSVLVKKEKDILTVCIKGEIDHHTVPAIREKIDDAILMNEDIKALVIDFNEVSFMDSSGVGLVMGRYRLIADKHITLEIKNLSKRDYKIMKMSGIEKLAKISKSQNEKRLGELL